MFVTFLVKVLKQFLISSLRCSGTFQEHLSFVLINLSLKCSLFVLKTDN